MAKRCNYSYNNNIGLWVYCLGTTYKIAMKIIDIYLEDNVIVMIIEGPFKVYLDNHADNRRLLKEFNKK